MPSLMVLWPFSLLLLLLNNGGRRRWVRQRGSLPPARRSRRLRRATARRLRTAGSFGGLTAVEHVVSCVHAAGDDHFCAADSRDRRERARNDHCSEMKCWWWRVRTNGGEQQSVSLHDVCCVAPDRVCRAQQQQQRVHAHLNRSSNLSEIFSPTSGVSYALLG